MRIKRPLVAVAVAAALAAAAGSYLSSSRTSAPRASLAPPPEATLTSAAEPGAAALARASEPARPTPIGAAQAPTSTERWPFGAGPRALGRGTSADGRPVAPASFLADADGLVVLDQENGRVMRADGTTLRLPGKRADDLARAADGALAILDRLGDASVTMLGPDGRVRGRLPLAGAGVDEGREVSRVVVSGRDVYVERNGGGPLLRIGSTDGKPAADRTEIPGIPTRDGRALLSAGITSEDEGRAWVTAADERGTHRWTRELKFTGELSAVGFVDGGARVAWVVLLAGSTPADYVNWAVCLDIATGRVRASTTLAVEASPWESFRDFAMRDDGTLVAAKRSDEGVAFASYPCGAAD